jgi:hypothetical protein
MIGIYLKQYHSDKYNFNNVEILNGYKNTKFYIDVLNDIIELMFNDINIDIFITHENNKDNLNFSTYFDDYSNIKPAKYK